MSGVVEPDRPTALIGAGSSLYPELAAALERIERVLKEVLASLGLPGLSAALLPDTALAPRDFRMRLVGDDASDAWTVTGLPAGSIVARSSPLHVGSRFQVSAEPWPDPADPRRRAALVRGATLHAVDPELGALSFDAAGAVELAIGAWTRRIAARTVDALVATRLLSALPAHDAAALLEHCGIDAVASTLAALVAEDVPVHALATIAPLLADENRVSWVAPGSVTAAFPGRLLVAAPRPDDRDERRLVIARAIAVPAWLRRRAAGEPLQVWMLDAPADGRLGDDADVVLAERTDGAATVAGAIVVTPSALRADVARRLHRHRPGMMVAAVHELPRGIRVQRRARIVLAPPDPSTDHASRRS